MPRATPRYASPSCSPATRSFISLPSPTARSTQGVPFSAARCTAQSASSGRLRLFIFPAKPTRSGSCGFSRAAPVSHSGLMPLGITAVFGSMIALSFLLSQRVSTFPRAASERNTTRLASRRIFFALPRRCGSYLQIVSMSL